MSEPKHQQTGEISFQSFKHQVLNDYRLACTSRQASLIGRKEVLTGKAKFGIFGDGKEVAQLAMAKQFRKGDWRAGYYRDQTFMFAIGESNIREFFAQLYANPDVKADPSSAGRSMNGHFATRSLDEQGRWKNLAEQYNSSSDISPTAGQMPRLLGLAWASKLFRNNSALHAYTQFSNKGNEVAFGTIGDASTSEGLFWESFNAAGVLQVPMAISVWDDGFGISVPAKYQTTKQNISEVLKGFERNQHGEGYVILRAKGWDYPGLCEMYEKGITICRSQQVPVLFHVQEMTQPQGHSTSGSHERYKTRERLQWEEEYDCIAQMRAWIIKSAIASDDDLKLIEDEARQSAASERKKAWDDFMSPIRDEMKSVTGLADAIAQDFSEAEKVNTIIQELNNSLEPSRKEVIRALKQIQYLLDEKQTDSSKVRQLLAKFRVENEKRYNSFLCSQSGESIDSIIPVAPAYRDDSPEVDGREILQANFDALFQQNDLLVAFGEDVGKIGDVNQGFAGLQSKHGEWRITDTGIREATIIGQGIGLALRGLRPIAEIQYLDYLLYALQVLSDDLATLQYRTMGGQKAPLIIRTRGHRLEGIWHSGSPMGMIIHALRGIHILVPRNMTQAAGFYNAMLSTDEPALIVECLNGYRLKEKMPANPGLYKVKPGEVEFLRTGNDVTIVSYGSVLRIIQEAADYLSSRNIHCEIIDIQSLLPFDNQHRIVESLKKTNKLLIVDEDVPGGASAFILQQILEVQHGFEYLDAAPVTLTSKPHRPAYGSDGDYFSKPNMEEIVDCLLTLMQPYKS